MNTTIKTLRMKDQKEEMYHHQSVFRSTRKRRAMLTIEFDKQETLKGEGIQMMF